MPVDYSRFDHIGDSDSDEEVRPPARVGPSLPAPPQAPGNVLEDLEDYFERLDAYRAEGATGLPSSASDADGDGAPASVERFTDDDFANLRRRTPGSAHRCEDLESAEAECAICLSALHADEDAVILPCAAAHCFHTECARGWFERDVTCPLCRVDVRRLTRAGSPRQAPMSPRAYGYTRDGGIIMSYVPRPPLDLPRPAYIDRELHGVAELVEINYPERGTARVWRVPRRPHDEPPPPR